MWAKSRAAELSYASRLKSIARVIGDIVKQLAPNGELKDPAKLLQVLTDYAKTIEPWARSVAASMVAEVFRRDQVMWRKISKEMSTNLRNEVMNAPTGHLLQDLQNEQVKLITSMPLEAAQRVHELAQEATLASIRPREIAAKIMEQEGVSKSKAMLIARTEVARAANNLVQARATFAGSIGYIWRTSGDLDVRDSHAEMEGEYVAWSSPPTLDNLKGHAGTLPNCRCFAEPIFPND